jgi:hypothetical protein
LSLVEEGSIMKLFKNYAAVAALALLATLAYTGNAFGATPVPLGNAASFGALSSTAMTNSGSNTVVNGDIGSSTSIGAGVTNGTGSKYGAGSTQLTNAQASLLTAYGNAEAQTPTGDITGVNLAGKVLIPGVYNSTGSILISGPTALTLNGNGDAGAVFIFQAAASGDLTVDPTSSVTYTNGAQPCNVFWKVQSAFLKNSGFTFVGTILALTQITLTDAITVNGRVLARNADVTFIHDTINAPGCAATAPAAPPPAPAREIYCDPVTGQTYDLVQGQDKQAPYAQLGLVLAAVDPVTGAKSCSRTAPAPVAAPVPTPVPTPVPLPPTPVKPTPTPKPVVTRAAKAAAAAKTEAAAKVAKAKAKALAAKRAAAVKAASASSSSTATHARPARKHVALTG